MMRFRNAAAGAAALAALAACGQRSAEAPEPRVVDEIRSCGAENYLDQLGVPLPEAVLPRGPELRVVSQGGLGQAIRRNDRPERLNLEVDAAGVIVGVYCG